VSAGSAIVLFDGVCNFCNGAVNFVIDRDPEARFRFASLQSEAGAALLRQHGLTLPEGDPESIVVVEGARVYERSSAVLRIVRHMTFPFWLAGAMVIVPAPIRDVFYRLVAEHRYRWFGKTNECRIPTPELRARLIS
jgi:predicted DCC family thiol-disulfide oxidoreductase YuxK